MIVPMRPVPQIVWLPWQMMNDSLISGNMTTIHAYTGDQNILDNSHKIYAVPVLVRALLCRPLPGQPKRSGWYCRNWMAS